MSKSTITFTLVANDPQPNPDDTISTDGQTMTYRETIKEIKRQSLAGKNQPKDPHASITPRRSYGKKNQRFPKGYM